MRSDDSFGFFVGGIVGVVILGGIVGIFAAGPVYNVWSKGQAGRAMLAEAESSRQVAVLEARAKKDSASMLAEAEIERAKGVAQANTIIGDSLRDNPEYLQYLYIQNLEAGSNSGNTVIYVPTEGGLPAPVLDYTHRAPRKAPAPATQGAN